MRVNLYFLEDVFLQGKTSVAETFWNLYWSRNFQEYNLTRFVGEGTHGI